MLQNKASESNKNALLNCSFSEVLTLKPANFYLNIYIAPTLSSFMVQSLRQTAAVWPGSFISLNPFVSTEARFKNSPLCRGVRQVQPFKSI